MSVNEVFLKPSEKSVKELNQIIKSEGLDLIEIENRILNSNNLHLIYLAGIYLENINLGRFSHAIAKSKDGYYIMNFTYFIIAQNKAINDSMLKDLINGIKKCEEAKFMYYFAKLIPSAPIEDIALSIASTNSSDYIFYTIRDLGSKLKQETKEILARRIIGLKDAGYIEYTSRLVPEISIEEYGIGILQATRTHSYGTHIYKFIEGKDFLNNDLYNKLIEALLSTSDFTRIVKLIENSNSENSIKLINQLLNNHINYSSSNFWLNYIIPLATSGCACASYVTDKIIRSGNIEYMTIALYYMKDEVLKLKLRSALKNIPNLNDAYDKANVSDKVIKRVLIQNIAG